MTLRLGGEAESYEGIRKGPVQVAGRPVLVDAEGPFGNPTSDSLRTSITLATTRCARRGVRARLATRPRGSTSVLDRDGGDARPRLRRRGGAAPPPALSRVRTPAYAGRIRCAE